MVSWDPVWGDRHSELVFIGLHLNKDGVREALEACLITESEFRVATEQKQRFEAAVKQFLEGEQTSSGEEKMEEDEDAMSQFLFEATGGLRCAFDSFLDLEDPWFGGRAVERFMEMEDGAAEAEDEEDDSGEEEEVSTEASSVGMEREDHDEKEK